MKRWWVVLAASLLSSCADTAHYYGEEFAMYYPAPAEETATERTDSKEILHWKSDPRYKKRIGYLYQYRTRVAGSRSDRLSWTIFDNIAMRAVGFVTAEGVFYRFDELGRLGQRVGEYPILPTGLKVFFGIPVEENVDLEEVDPYRAVSTPSEVAPKKSPAEGEPKPAEEKPKPAKPAKE